MLLSFRVDESWEEADRVQADLAEAKQDQVPSTPKPSTPTPAKLRTQVLVWRERLVRSVLSVD